MKMNLAKDKFIIYGPKPYEPVSENTIGKEIFDILLTNVMNTNAMIDAFTGKTLSYKSLLEKSCELADALRSNGYTVGTVVSISSENNLEFFIPVLASLFIGCVVAPINHNYTSHEMKHILNISKPKIIFCSKSVSSNIIALKESLSYLEKIVIIDSDESTCEAESMNVFVRRSLKGKSVFPYTFQPFEGDSEKVGAFILSSSGTTGLPKGVLISHKNFMVKLAQSRLKNLKSFLQGYGLTETTFAVTVTTKGEERTGSCGKVVSFMKCIVRDPETGKRLGPYQTGELCFKGPLVMMGYYNDEKATRETFTSDGWLKTGDLGYYDDNEYFYIVDRLKELIKYKGFQVPPAELEALLLSHPKVRDVGVVGLPDETAGELPLAFVVTNMGQDVTEKELQEYISSMVSPQKWLRGGVIFVSEIPKNPSGKILRRELREWLKSYRSPKSKL